MSIVSSSRTAFAAVACLVSTLRLYGDPIGTYVDSAIARRLQNGEAIRASSEATLSLAPVHPISANFAAAIASEKPDVVVEALFLWKRPGGADRSIEALAVYNTLRAVGSLQGIEYYSVSRGRMRVLYEHSSLVAGPDGAVSVPDAWVATVPANPEILYARQKDTTFGDNRYKLTLTVGPGFVTQASTNLTRMSLGIVPVAEPGNINVRILVLSTDDGLLFYVASSAKVALIPGLRGRIEESFGNRAAAVYAWFARAMDAEGRARR